MPKFILTAAAFGLALAASVTLAQAQKGGAPFICTEAGFQRCMNKCTTNMMVSNGSRIAYKCSNRCHHMCANGGPQHRRGG
jgi:hypothetical protein